MTEQKPDQQPQRPSPLPNIVGHVEMLGGIMLGTVVAMFTIGAVDRWASNTDWALLAAATVLSVLAVGCALISMNLRIERHRRDREQDRDKDWRAWVGGRVEGDERRHRDVMSAIHASSKVLHGDHQMVTERIDKLSDDTAANLGEALKAVRQILAAQEAMLEKTREVVGEVDEARWKLIAEQFRQEFGISTNGKTVVPIPMRRSVEPPAN